MTTTTQDRAKAEKRLIAMYARDEQAALDAKDDAAWRKARDLRNRCEARLMILGYW